MLHHDPPNPHSPGICMYSIHLLKHCIHIRIAHLHLSIWHITTIGKLRSTRIHPNRIYCIITELVLDAILKAKPQPLHHD